MIGFFKTMLIMAIELGIGFPFSSRDFIAEDKRKIFDLIKIKLASTHLSPIVF